MDAGSTLWPRVKTAAVIVLALTFFCVVGWNLEVGDDFEQARDVLGPNHRGIGMVESLAELIDEHDLEGDVLDQFPNAASALLSTSIVDTDDHREGWPLLSLVVTPHDLHDPSSGIMANPLQRGRGWERTGQVSYFEDGAEVVSSRVGVRMHGGDERRALGTTPMFRLYFRERYRPDPNRPSILGGGEEPRATRWVIRHPPHTNFFANVFAFEIARRNGALTPRFRPVRFFLNGDWMGTYLLIEQINRSGWGDSNFEHDDYLLYVYRDAGDPHEESAAAYAELQAWANDPAVEMTLAEAARRIDVDNYARHLLTFAFAGERDPYQGAAFLDLRDDDPKWRWLHYDLDQSFVADGVLPPVIDGDKPGFRLFTDHLTGERGTDIRAVLFRRLLRDPAFVDFFAGTVLGLLNHSIDQEFLQDLVARYAYTGDPPGNFSGIDIAAFMRERPAWLVADLRDVLRTGPVHEVTVEIPAGAAVEVDGHAKQAPYHGWYRAGDSIELSAGGAAGFSHWLIDGEIVGENRLDLPIDRPRSIVAVFR